MTRHVVDVNVLRTANGEARHASADCQEACIDFLLELRDAGTLLLDEGNEILALYALSNNFAGQPGVGDQFFLWAHNHQAFHDKVVLTPIAEETYAEVPDELASFDRDDHVYLAVAAAGGPSAVIVNAVDTDYRDARPEIAAAGLSVLELC